MISNEVNHWNTHINGKPFTEMPKDLFIPPDALEILLDSFTGPFDLLLYLIRKQNIDILDIPIVLITKQYMHYIHLLEVSRFELAAEYLVMAATLAEIKSRYLLPKQLDNMEESDEDPRLDLVRKLQLYEQFKQAAIALDDLPRCERDIFRFSIKAQGIRLIKPLPEITLEALITQMQQLIKRQGHQLHHQIIKETLSVQDKMVSVLAYIQQTNMTVFHQLLTASEGRKGVIVTFLAILELARQSLIVITQLEQFSLIHLEATS